MMTRKKIYASIFGIMLLLLSAFAMSSCTKPVQLATPTGVRLTDDEYLTWGEVENADGYILQIDGEDYVLQTNEFDVFEKYLTTTTIKVSVFAYSDDKKYLNSQPSEIQEITIEVCPVEGSGAYRKRSDGMSYEFAIIDPTKVVGKYVVPSEYEGLPVVHLYDNAFKDCTFLTSVYIPDSVESFGDTVFKNCTSLTRVKIPSNVDYLYGTFVDCVSLKSVTFPKNLSRFFSPFFRCFALEEIKIEEGNEHYKVDGNCLIPIDSSGVSLGCKTSVIPSYVSCIWDDAFRGSGIKEITIPSNVKIIYPSAFEYCEYLEYVDASHVEEIGAYVFMNTPALKTVILGDKLQTLSNALFKESGVTNLDIPDSVKTIRNGTFINCENLEYVDASHVEEIGREAFSFTPALNTVVLGDKLQVLPTLLFEESGITSLHIPKNVTEIQIATIANCENLTSLTVASDNATFRSEGNCVIDRETNEIVLGCQVSVIPKSVVGIGERAFLGCPFGSVVIPGNVKIIRARAFYECANLKEVFICEGVEEIISMIFMSPSVPSITIPQSIKSLYKTTSLERYAPFDEKTTEAMGLAETDYIESNIAYDEYGEEKIPYVVSMVVPKKRQNYGGFHKTDICMGVPTRKGYTFAGWATEPTGEVVYAPLSAICTYDYTIYEPYTQKALSMTAVCKGCFTKETVNELLKKEEDMIFYAVWNKAYDI